MKLIASAAVASAAFLVAVAHAQVPVAAHVDIYSPGVYGRIDVGALPPVAVVQPQPVIILPPAPVMVPVPGTVVAPVVAPPPPVYLYVPPGHQKNWKHYCARYHACNERVLFVREDWVRAQYAKAHPEHGRGHEHGRGDEDHHEGHDRDDGPGRGHHDGD